MPTVAARRARSSAARPERSGRRARLFCARSSPRKRKAMLFVRRGESSGELGVDEFEVGGRPVFELEPSLQPGAARGDELPPVA